MDAEGVSTETPAIAAVFLLPEGWLGGGRGSRASFYVADLAQSPLGPKFVWAGFFFFCSQRALSLVHHLSIVSVLSHPTLSATSALSRVLLSPPFLVPLSHSLSSTRLVFVSARVCKNTRPFAPLAIKAIRSTPSPLVQP